MPYRATLPHVVTHTLLLRSHGCRYRGWCVPHVALHYTAIYARYHIAAFAFHAFCIHAPLLRYVCYGSSPPAHSFTPFTHYRVAVHRLVGLVTVGFVVRCCAVCSFAPRFTRYVFALRLVYAHTRVYALRLPRLLPRYRGYRSGFVAGCSVVLTLRCCRLFVLRFYVRSTPLRGLVGPPAVTFGYTRLHRYRTRLVTVLRLPFTALPHAYGYVRLPVWLLRAIWLPLPLRLPRLRYRFCGSSPHVGLRCGCAVLHRVAGCGLPCTLYVTLLPPAVGSGFTTHCCTPVWLRCRSVLRLPHHVPLLMRLRFVLRAALPHTVTLARCWFWFPLILPFGYHTHAYAFCRTRLFVRLFIFCGYWLHTPPQVRSFAVTFTAFDLPLLHHILLAAGLVTCGCWLPRTRCILSSLHHTVYHVLDCRTQLLRSHFAVYYGCHHTVLRARTTAVPHRGYRVPHHLLPFPRYLPTAGSCHVTYTRYYYVLLRLCHTAYHTVLVYHGSRLLGLLTYTFMVTAHDSPVPLHGFYDAAPPSRWFWITLHCLVDLPTPTPGFYGSTCPYVLPLFYRLHAHARSVRFYLPTVTVVFYLRIGCYVTVPFYVHRCRTLWFTRNNFARYVCSCTRLRFFTPCWTFGLILHCVCTLHVLPCTVTTAHFYAAAFNIRSALPVWFAGCSFAIHTVGSHHAVGSVGYITALLRLRTRLPVCCTLPRTVIAYCSRSVPRTFTTVLRLHARLPRYRYRAYTRLVTALVLHALHFIATLRTTVLLRLLFTHRYRTVTVLPHILTRLRSFYRFAFTFVAGLPVTAATVLYHRILDYAVAVTYTPTPHVTVAFYVGYRYRLRLPRTLPRFVAFVPLRFTTALRGCTFAHLRVLPPRTTFWFYRSVTVTHAPYTDAVYRSSAVHRVLHVCRYTRLCLRFTLPVPRAGLPPLRIGYVTGCRFVAVYRFWLRLFLRGSAVTTRTPTRAAVPVYRLRLHYVAWLHVLAGCLLPAVVMPAVAVWLFFAVRLRLRSGYARLWLRGWMPVTTVTHPYGYRGWLPVSSRHTVVRSLRFYTVGWLLPALPHTPHAHTRAFYRLYAHFTRLVMLPHTIHHGCHRTCRCRLVLPRLFTFTAVLVMVWLVVRLPHAFTFYPFGSSWLHTAFCVTYHVLLGWITFITYCGYALPVGCYAVWLPFTRLRCPRLRFCGFLRLPAFTHLPFTLRFYLRTARLLRVTRARLCLRCYAVYCGYARWLHLLVYYARVARIPVTITRLVHYTHTHVYTPVGWFADTVPAHTTVLPLPDSCRPTVTVTPGYTPLPAPRLRLRLRYTFTVVRYTFVTHVWLHGYATHHHALPPAVTFLDLHVCVTTQFPLRCVHHTHIRSCATLLQLVAVTTCYLPTLLPCVLRVRFAFY